MSIGELTNLYLIRVASPSLKETKVSPSPAISHRLRASRHVNHFQVVEPACIQILANSKRSKQHEMATEPRKTAMAGMRRYAAGSLRTRSDKSMQMPQHDANRKIGLSTSIVSPDKAKGVLNSVSKIANYSQFQCSDARLPAF